MKDKKGGYEDVELLVVKMDTLFNQLNANYENSYIKNWHQTRYKLEFIKLASEWETLLNADSENSKKMEILLDLTVKVNGDCIKTSCGASSLQVIWIL